MDQSLVDRFEELLESDQSDPEIQYQIGLCYQRGEGVEQSGTEAEKWLRRAEAQGHQGAATLLAGPAGGQEHLTGEITPETLPDWCLLAERGDAGAQYKVGRYFLKEPETQEEGERYLEKAVEQGSGQACLILGRRMLERDQAEQAVAMLRRAVDGGGQPEAAFLLGRCYMEGTGVPQNAEMAEQYVAQGAETGGSEAMVEVAARYTVGNGLPHAPVKGLSWLKRAEKAGLQDARARYDARCAQLEREEQEQAKQAAQEEQRALEAFQQTRAERARRAEVEQFRRAEDAKQAAQAALHQAEALRQAEEKALQEGAARLREEQEQMQKRGRLGRFLLLLGVLGPLEAVCDMALKTLLGLFHLPSLSLPGLFGILRLPLLLTPICLTLMAGGLQKMRETGDDTWYFDMTGKKAALVSCAVFFTATMVYMVSQQLAKGWSIFSVLWGLIQGCLSLGGLAIFNYGLIEVLKIKVDFFDGKSG